MAGNVASKRRAALLELLKPEHKSQADAAQAAGVTLRQVQRWLAQPDFRRELEEAQRQLKADALRRLAGMQGQAVEALRALLADEETTPALRLQTAKAVLQAHTALEESVTFEERLQALEERLGLQEAL